MIKIISESFAISCLELYFLTWTFRSQIHRYILRTSRYTKAKIPHRVHFNLSLSPQVQVYFFNPACGDETTMERVQSGDLTSCTDGPPRTGSLKRHSYDCAVHLKEISLSNNNEVNESGNENLSETDSETESAWKDTGKKYRKETFV